MDILKVIRVYSTDRKRDIKIKDALSNCIYQATMTSRQKYRVVSQELFVEMSKQYDEKYYVFPNNYTGYLSGSG